MKASERVMCADLPPSKEELLDSIVPREHSYRRRLVETSPYGGIGHYARWIYFSSKELKARDRIRKGVFAPEHSFSDYLEDSGKAFRIGGVIATSIRVVDDVLDGHSCEKLREDRREDFLGRYIDSAVRGKEHGDVGHPVEKIAYRSGREIYRMIDSEEVLEDIEDRLRKMEALIRDEDKSTLEGYREATEADGKHYSALVVDGMQILPTFDPGEEIYQIALDAGALYAAVDDLVDGDIEMPEEDLRRYHREAYRKFSSHRGLLVKLVGLPNASTAPYRATLNVKRMQMRFRGLLSSLPGIS